MLIGALSSVTLRQNYLRGIELGSGWYGPSAESALERLLQAQLSLAEARMNIQFRSWRIATAPESTLIPGTDYDIPGRLIPYVAPEQGATAYGLRLGYHDVQSLQRVRLYEGTAGFPPAPVYETVDLATVAFDRQTETLSIPTSQLLTPALGQGWAIDYTIGLGQVPDEVAEWIYLGVAIRVLSMAGAGVSHGLVGERLDQDGIIEDIRYAGHGEHGMYAGPINIFRAQRDEIDLGKLRMRYQGSLGIG